MLLLISFLSTICFKGKCQDSDNGKTDLYEANCANGYNEYPEACGFYDDDDFTANSMCCACKSKFFKSYFRKWGQSLYTFFLKIYNLTEP